MKTLLFALAAVAAMVTPAHAQYGYDSYPPQDDRYVCQAEGCVSADPPYYDPGYDEPYDQPYEQPYDGGYEQRDARCDYGCAHYHWDEAGQAYGDEGYGYGYDPPMDDGYYGAGRY